METSPKLTAIICTRNRASFLEKCLASLLCQTASAVDYEILVVDNGSTDNTADILSKFVDNSHVRSLYEPVAGLSRARNAGWKNARGALVGYIDDDATVDKNWVQSVLWVVDNIDPIPDWIGGPIYLDWESTSPEWINEELRVPLGYLYWGDKPRQLTSSERLGGGNSIYLKSRLVQLDGFDERLGRGASGLLSGEETQLQRRLEAADGTLFYHPGISINHFVSKERTVPAWFYRRYFWGGVSDVIMSKTFSSAGTDDVKQSASNRVIQGRNRLARLYGSCLAAVGVGSQGTVILGRIYFCYVLGFFYGFIRWKYFEKNQL